MLAYASISPAQIATKEKEAPYPPPPWPSSPLERKCQEVGQRRELPTFQIRQGLLALQGKGGRGALLALPAHYLEGLGNRKFLEESSTVPPSRLAAQQTAAEFSRPPSYRYTA